MGAKSKHDISRALAIEIIKERVGTCTNAQIANMLEEFDESAYISYEVYDELSSVNEKELEIGDFYVD